MPGRSDVYLTMSLQHSGIWSIGIRSLVVALCFRPLMTMGGDTSRHWIGAGTNALASTRENWVRHKPPATGDTLIFDDSHRGNRWTNVIWDLNISPASWIQTEAFEGTVSILTKYPDAAVETGFTNLVIAGDLVLQGGVWTHPPNAGGKDGHQATDRLSVKVGGDMMLGAGAGIDVSGRGFAVGRGPGAGRSSQRTGGYAASHGGQGGFSETHFMNPAPSYGCATQPEYPGSGASGPGGGALFLRVSGTATLDGAISADGRRPTRGSPDRFQGGAGGSIYVRAASIDGKGILSANGGSGYDSGGGGRIALVATATPAPPEDGFGALRLTARPGTPATQRMGAAGTVFLQTDAGSRLVIDPRREALNRSPQSEVFTGLPADHHESPFHPVIGGVLEDTVLVMHRGAVAGLTSCLRMGDLVWLEEGSTLRLHDHRLYFKATAPDPQDGFPASRGGGIIDPGAAKRGAIVWGDALPRISLSLKGGPHGSVVADRFDPDHLYRIGESVRAGAYPDPGYEFVFWTGELPEDADRHANPLTINMDRCREIRALFASSDPDTMTWIGDGKNAWAGNPTNWYPRGVPETGTHIVLNGSSVKAVDWDVDAAVGSWTQTAGYVPSYNPVTGVYEGWVFFHTRYAGQGEFTNFWIQGDARVEGGVWSHPSNRRGTAAVNRLSVSVGADFLLGQDAEIDVYGRGFSTAGGQRGPGGGTASQRSWSRAVGASHGGLGGFGTRVSPAPSYGSIVRPATLGSSGSRRGGGNVRLVAGGAATIEGRIDAGGDAASSNNHIPGSGGSILLQAAAFSGSGRLTARGNYGTRSSGGGRIALIATQTNAFGNLSVAARSRNTGGNTHLDTVCGKRAQGAAGTIYYASPKGRRLVVDGGEVLPMASVYTDLPALLEADDLDRFHDVELELSGHARVRITRDNLRIRDLTWMDADSRLYLDGHTLHVRALYHPFTDGDEDTVVVKDGGNIAWNPPGTLVTIP